MGSYKTRRMSPDGIVREDIVSTHARSPPQLYNASGKVTVQPSS